MSVGWGQDCDEGYVPDCSGDGDCCSEDWIGDGYCDNEDQSWGCDLICYEEELSDCGHFPQLYYHPSELSEQLEQNNSSTIIFTIVNNGDENLEWEVLNQDEIPNWLSFTIYGGFLEPGSLEEIDVTFDSSELNVGEYNSTITISSNDPFNGEIDVPVSLTIISQSTCEDGYVELWGECYTITFTTYLDLSEMGLSGEIPSEIGDLTNLTNLDLGGNQLSGEIPSEIGNLTNLTVLDLGGNQLFGKIPPDICNLTNLTELELGGNQLMEGIPSCIGNLTNLTFLHLEYNQLSGEIPSEIGNLTNLIWLNFIHNQLSGEIPSSICNLDMSWSNPDNFNIYENQLCPPYPECVEDYIGEQDTSECGEPDPQIGDECVTQDGWIGFYDCELCCWEEWIIENWLGDGWCDYLGGCGFEGPLFNCPELGYDCGDCTEDWDGTDPSGLCSDDCLFPGDVNNDSILNILDIVLMITLILDGEYDECGDVNSDGDLNILDVITFVNIILSIP